MGKQKKIALVTGATGFVGKHLCIRLIKDGWDVHAIVRPTSDISFLEKYSNDKITFHYYNGTNGDIVDILSTVKPLVVFHLASLFLSQHKFSDIELLIQSNIVFSTQLIDAMVQNKIVNLVNTGTSWQHYNNEDYNPVCLYAATKQAFESILKYYQAESHLKVITLKLFDTYGPNDTRPKLFSLLNRISVSQETLPMSPGEQYIDLVHIDDVVESFLLASAYVQNGEYLGDYAVSSGQPIQLKELVSIYEKLLNKPLNILWGGRPYREREVMMPWNKGKVLPGWAPKVNIQEGIKKYNRGNLDIIRKNLTRRIPGFLICFLDTVIGIINIFKPCF